MYEIKIGTVFKRTLKAQHKSLKGISQDTGIPYSTLHTWLENRQPKDVVKLRRLAQHLGLSLEQLLFDLPANDSPIENRLNSSNPLMEDVFEISVRRLE